MRAMIEAIVAFHYGISEADFRQITAKCDHPVDAVGSKEFSGGLDPKGFWRVEKQIPPELRLSVLCQIAFFDLIKNGLKDFFGANEGEGWIIPEAVRLADYGLGHDQRANEYQPVASVLGSRFYPWQLDQSVEESWEECERHAEILGKLLPQPEPESELEAEDGAPRPAVDLFGDPLPTDLFGNLLTTKSSRR